MPRAASRARGARPSRTSCSAQVNESVRPTASAATATSPRSSRSSPGSPACEGLDPSANPGIVARRLPPPPHPDDPRDPVGLPRPPDAGRSARPSSTTLYAATYADEPFVTVVATPPATKDVTGSQPRPDPRHARRADRPDPRHRRRGQPRQGRRGPGHPGVQPRPRPARDGRPRPAAARAMTTMSERPVPASSPDLPPVERRAAIPPGFRGRRTGRRDQGLGPAGSRRRASRRRVRPPRPPSSPRTRSRPRPSACRRRISRRRPATRAAGSAGPRRSSRRAARANAATGAAGDADQAEIATMLAAATGVAGRADAPPVDGDHRHATAAREGPGRARGPRADARGDGDDGLLAAGRGAADHRFGRSRSRRRRSSCRTTPGARSGSPSAGIAKGVGMIHPRMATMLSIVLTDATVAPEVLWGLLRPAAARTWDQLSVDGDTSTNDTVFVLASGASGSRAGGGRFERLPSPSALRSRRSRATWRASRRPTARAPARSSPRR